MDERTMRDKPDKQPTEPTKHSRQSADGVSLSKPIKLPPPAQLAQIAAGFGIQTAPAVAVKKAVSLYLHAREFVAKHNNLPVLDIARGCGDHELAHEIRYASVMAAWVGRIC